MSHKLYDIMQSRPIFPKICRLFFVNRRIPKQLRGDDYDAIKIKFVSKTNLGDETKKAQQKYIEKYLHST